MQNHFQMFHQPAPCRHGSMAQAVLSQTLLQALPVVVAGGTSPERTRVWSARRSISRARFAKTLALLCPSSPGGMGDTCFRPHRKFCNASDTSETFFLVTGGLARFRVTSWIGHVQHVRLRMRDQLTPSQRGVRTPADHPVTVGLDERRPVSVGSPGDRKKRFVHCVVAEALVAAVDVAHGVGMKARI